ncbi:MAG: glycosyltransferase family 4 protein [Gammaproteobacteria bacterium]|nr:glycosyltransferase family 4 protein [Gammaproteobacteria bacterium]
MKIAFVHDWLTGYAGAERVLEQMLLCFPDADIYSLIDFIPDDGRGFIQNKKTTTSILQRLPLARTKYRQYLMFMPFMVEQFDLSKYDLVISSSHAVAKGVLTGPDQLHICMCYSPIRYAWDLQHQYLKESGLDAGVKSWLAKWVLHKVRIWDARTANGVDEFIAISNFIERRIFKAYHRNSTVIYPPVAVDEFLMKSKKDDFYVTASRMVPYKKIDLIVEAFSEMPSKKLIVIGGGPDFKKIQRKAGTNVELVGYQGFDNLRGYLQRARAFVFSAEEDFGIAPVEAQACGTPVIAFGKGGATETIRGLGSDFPTGVFFWEQTVASIQLAVEAFEKEENNITPEACRENAMRFSSERFRNEFSNFVQDKYEKHCRSIVCSENVD